MSPPLQASSRAFARGLFGAALILLAWEFAARGLELPHYILPAVSTILAHMASDASSLLSAGRYTFIEAATGFAIGGLAGIASAVLVSMVPASRGVVLPIATAINSVPVVAYSPLVLLWFGIGMSSKIVMVAIAVSFTVFLNTIAGLDRVDRRQAELMRSFGASRFAVFWRLRLPTALPLILAGLRISTVRSIIVAIVTEMLGAYDGLGWIIYQAVLRIDFVAVWAAIAVASLISLGFFALVSMVERKAVFWT
ncbi:ABC transporter permease [Aureimonas populi]|uniref:ABC transporter permease n=1 Tax=Aureimonas populi TaxID=1701758 RepID=A0ABW5CQG2_9HYPH|nr:ABC transporter permease [Aureimonas populi]